MRKSQLSAIFVITLSVIISISLIDASAQEDDTTPQKTHTIVSEQDKADGFDGNQMAFIISPGATEFSGSITFEATVPVDVVVFNKDPGHTVWTLDHENFFGFNVIESEITNGKLFFTGVGLAFLEPFTEEFEVVYTLELDSDENLILESEIEETEIIEEEIAEDYVLPPLQQMKSGIKPENVQCKEGYTLIFKSNDRNPACVSIDTAFKLQNNYGWGLTGDSTEIENVESEIPDENIEE